MFFLGWFLIIFQNAELTTLEYIGRISAMGLMCGVIGINVGHELGHRNNRFDELLGEVLLLLPRTLIFYLIIMLDIILTWPLLKMPQPQEKMKFFILFGFDLISKVIIKPGKPKTNV